MRRRWGQALRVGIALDGVSLLCTSRWHGPALTVLAECRLDTPLGGASAAAYAGLEQALERLLGGPMYAGWPVSFVLADDLLRLWQVTPPPGAAQLADLEAAALARFQRLYGEGAAAWVIEAAWDTRQPFFAAAMARPLLSVLQHSASQHRLVITEMTPHFMHQWQHWRGKLKAGAWFGLVSDRALSIGVIQAQRLSAVRVLALPERITPEWLTQVLRREALLLDVALPTLLQLCGAVPQLWRDQAGDAQAGDAGRIASAVLESAPWDDRLSAVTALAGSGWRR